MSRHGTRSERALGQALTGILVYGETQEDLGMNISSVRSFEDVGMLTMNAGLVLRFQDGSEYQLTIVERHGPVEGKPEEGWRGDYEDDE